MSGRNTAGLMPVSKAATSKLHMHSHHMYSSSALLLHILHKILESICTAKICMSAH